MLIDVDQVTFRSIVSSDWGSKRWVAHLIVEPWLMSRFDEETRESIRDALDLAARHQGMEVTRLDVFPREALPGWREKLQEQLSSGPRNQATVAQLPPNHPRADGMAFRTQDELAVYHSLRNLQEAFPADDTFAIVPNCAARVPQHTWEPDFFIIYRGRCAVIEVDGNSHHKKYLSDKSRDEILTDSGIAFVKRIDSRDVADDNELNAFVRRFLERLKKA